MGDKRGGCYEKDADNIPYISTIN